jgi:hypothetical protein
MTWKRFFFLLMILMFAADLTAQTDTTNRQTDTSNRRVGDTSKRKQDSTNRRRDTVRPVTPRPPTPRPEPQPVTRDTVAIDTVATTTDSLSKDSITVIVPATVFTDTSTYYAYYRHPHLGFNKTPVYMLMKARTVESKDTVFYLLAGLLFFVAFTRLLFPKYFQNTFRLFFQTSFRQKQTRDQLLQQSLGSLLLNLLFFFSGACYLTLVLDHYEWSIFPFWKLLLYSLILLAVLYIGKFIFLRFAGWVFNAKEGAETYIFIVFLINKIIGVMLIPFILVIAFAKSSLADAALTASVILLIMLFVYRYFVSLQSFRRDLHISPFHFFLYLCGVEIVPLLVIGKVVFNYIDGRF